MSYCRTTLVEFNSEKDADEAHADYSKNAPSEFPEAEILLSTRTGPTSAVVTSVYPDKETAKKATAARNAIPGKSCTQNEKHRDASRRSDFKSG